MGLWAWLRCRHDDVRCTHGDEINARRFRRRVCLACGRALEGPLPVICEWTGEIHPSYLNEEQSDGRP